MEICKAARCTGCGVCVDACPQNCISFRHDEYGFYRSYVDESKCVNCHRCSDVCPANHPNKGNSIQKAYKARRLDKIAAAKSSSGGIASVLSEAIVADGGAVFGCGFDDALCLRHSMAESMDELENFKGSKYLQSNTVGVYRQVREQVRSGRKVLFVGTPCQVAGLQNYLGKQYGNLYTIDLVCHGVGSQNVLDKYLQSLDSLRKPDSVQFRNKTCGYRNKRACAEMEVVYPERTVRNTTESGIYYWFATSLSVRDSCYKCPFVSVQRSSDITLADYSGNDLDEVDNEIGVNMLFVNSSKGAELIEGVKQKIALVPKECEEAVEQCTRLIYTSYKPACRKDFFDMLPVSDYQMLVRMFDADRILPSKMVRRYRAMIRKIQNLFRRRG